MRGMSQVLPRHMPALDGLRGVAILLVVLTHACDGWRRALMTTQDADWMRPLQVPHWLALICERGAFGVTLFFVVSAFTLTVQAGRRDDGLLPYAVRRVARVGPGYWLAGVGYTLFAGLGPRLLAPDGVGTADLAIAAVFSSAWQGGAALAVVPGGWSVSCEVAFYCALPLLLWLIAGKLWRAVLLTAVALIGAQMLGRHAFTHGGLTTQVYFHPALQSPVFLFGITAAMAVRRVRLPRVPGLALVLLAVAIVGLPFLPVPEWHLMHHLAFAAVVAAVVALSAWHPPVALATNFMRRLGEVSYSIYLLHFALLAPCLWLAECIAPGDGVPTLLLHVGLTAGCSFGLACLTYRWIEQPCIQAVARLLRTHRPSYGV